MKKGITTIIFDLSEVYLKGYYLVEEKLEKILNLPAKEIHNKLREKVLEEYFDNLMKGKITEEMFWEKVLKVHKWKISVKSLKEAVRDNFDEISGTRKIIESLRKRGYKMGLLSNHSKEWIEHCEKKFDYHKLFHSTLYSFEIGACKPDKITYLKIIEMLNSKPEECLFIDDSLENTKSAEKLGIKTILFNNSQQLTADLEKLGVY